jgi:imidazole glycerol-phosphate synthase subunit HisH
MNKSVTIIDYGMGNLWSVVNAFHYLGCDPIVTNDPNEISRAEVLILPGVGSFRKAMKSLVSKGIDEAIIDAVQNKGGKILGICLGMQLLGVESSEDGKSSGLGLIPQSVDRFSPQELGINKLPHIGFNLVHSTPDSKLFHGLPDKADFYFVHSYHMPSQNLSGISATCIHGIEFLAAYEQDNIYATQFHPEKSQTNGLLLLKNFLAL